MSSSMRNAIQRRNHKERAQPESRQKWGLLEKHKDYALRAADHKRKRKQLKNLRDKARDRNPDEFHFGMMSTKASAGVKLGDRGNKVLSHEVASLLKTQDGGYLRTILQKTRSQMEKTKYAMKLLDGKVQIAGDEGKTGKKTVFVDDLAPYQDQAGGQGEQDLPSTTIDDLHQSSDQDTETMHRTTSQRRLRQTLQALVGREAQLTATQRELDLQRARMAGSIGGVNKIGVNWKLRERKR